MNDSSLDEICEIILRVIIILIWVILLYKLGTKFLQETNNKTPKGIKLSLISTSINLIIWNTAILIENIAYMTISENEEGVYKWTQVNPKLSYPP